MKKVKKNNTWLGFTLNTPEDKARARFVEKYGYPPAGVERDSILSVGPVQKKNEEEELWQSSLWPTRRAA